MQMASPGQTIRFTPDYSPRIFKCGLAFSAINHLQKLDFRTFFLHPAKLRSTHRGASHISHHPTRGKTSPIPLMNEV